ncbi:MAG: hypothetical protein ABH881_01580 [bacterium]
MRKKLSKNIKTVLEILRDETSGNVKAALKKLADDYSMTWMYRTKKGKIFPRTRKNLRKKLEEVYLIKNREYDIKHVAEGDGVVMIEMIESYPDPKTKKVYRTPLVIILEMQNGKIKKGRHYCDPDLSYLYLTKEQVKQAYK